MRQLALNTNERKVSRIEPKVTSGNPPHKWMHMAGGWTHAAGAGGVLRRAATSGPIWLSHAQSAKASKLLTLQGHIFKAHRARPEFWILTPRCANWARSPPDTQVVIQLANAC
ncbi:unnamed protein product [Effrenium voratum]|nr:unnamed protein product [Effrenium voratum]